MAITLAPPSSQLFQGLAADPKPGTTGYTGVYQPVINAVFFETDTFKWLLWNGSAWNPTANAAPYLVPPMA